MDPDILECQRHRTSENTGPPRPLTIASRTPPICSFKRDPLALFKTILHSAGKSCFLKSPVSHKNFCKKKKGPLPARALRIIRRSGSSSPPRILCGSIELPSRRSPRSRAASGAPSWGCCRLIDGSEDDSITVPMITVRPSEWD